ncbi:hypothetical protein HanPI659440_Chr17g0688211 [Helianthus annuus]|nr:hypothetical protein HanPI659440_Chr17g0688211 [Helianthus annuus]
MNSDGAPPPPSGGGAAATNRRERERAEKKREREPAVDVIDRRSASLSGGPCLGPTSILQKFMFWFGFTMLRWVRRLSVGSNNKPGSSLVRLSSAGCVFEFRFRI